MLLDSMTWDGCVDTSMTILGLVGCDRSTVAEFAPGSITTKRDFYQE